MQDSRDHRREGGSTPLLASALRQFAAVGFDGASLQRIADDAGLSKSSVVYHFGSKEALLDAALRPAVDDLRDLLVRLPALVDDAARRRFLDPFVDYLFEHRLSVSVLINHGSALAGHPVIDEADGLVRRLAAGFGSARPCEGADLDALRFGVALAGAAFVLVAGDRWGTALDTEGDVRAALLEVLADAVLDRGAPLPA